MLAPACETNHTSDSVKPTLTETVATSVTEDLNPGEETVEEKNNRIEKQDLKSSVDEIDTEGEDADSISPCATVVPSNTPVTGDSGHVSPTMESSLDSLSDGSQQQQDTLDNCDVIDTVAAKVTATLNGDEFKAEQNCGKAVATLTFTSFSILNKEETNNSPSSSKIKAVKENKKEEKKKYKKKEDKGGEHILRALNSLDSPEEKLAALCKKFADLHEEHRVMENSCKAQQRRLAVVAREKEQIQSEHTKAMMAKSKLESLCRELQKHNKVIENESIKRAKESEDKRKEISAHFSTTINEIQNQMTDNSEKNNILRKENENLAEQLRNFITQCQTRDEHVKKLQEQHDLENKLAAAKLDHAEAIIKEAEERNNKERELLLMKLTEMSKKSQLTETQLELYKSKYDEFSDLHTRSSETFQKYKVEMDKMTKRIKRLEKDGLLWKTKWETTNKTLLEQYELKSKSEQEAAVYAQKVKKLESLCRALQAELHRKVVITDDKEKAEATSPEKKDTLEESSVPPNSPDRSSQDSTSQESTLSDENSHVLPGTLSSKVAATNSSSSTTALSPELSICPSSHVPEPTAVVATETGGSCSVEAASSVPNVSVNLEEQQTSNVIPAECSSVSFFFRK